MYVDAFHGDQESTLQEFTLRAEPLLLVLWTITSISFSLAAAIGYLCDCNPVLACGRQLIVANVNVACNPELVVHLRATDVAGLLGIGGTTKLEEIGTHPLWDDVSSIEVNRTTSSAYIKHRFMVYVS